MKRLMLSLLLVLLAIAASIALVLWLHVDDWNRDLTQNTAQTSESARDPLLRPLTAPVSPDQLAQHVAHASHQLRGWSFAGSATLPDGSQQLDFVRTTRLMRYRDDIRVTISPAPATTAGQPGALLNARSQSRIGKGDLGQNPRNLKELLTVVRKLLNEPLPTSAPAATATAHSDPTTGAR